MNIEKNKVVALTYELTVEGKVADKATEEAPLDYIHGNHMLLPKFEAELEGKKPGDEFAFTLTPEEGYGVHDPKLRFDIPKSTFEVDGALREDLLVVGAVIPLLNSSGQVIQAQIMEVKEDAVNMDFNHPMAGKTLDFKGKIVSVRDATEAELKNGLHGEFLPQDDCGCGHEGCGCGHHHDDCDHHHGDDCGCGHCH
ncbi:MAG: peptidylprolyl isomerase [Bacteroidales bacterium]|nr:peptidylprolyl isomerase [Bacteroidales bacterium]